MISPGARRWVVAAAVVAALLIAGAVGRELFLRRAHDYACQHALRQLWCALQMYQMDHDGAYTPSLQNPEYTRYGLSDIFFNCGGRRTPSDPSSSDQARGDYLYVAWATGASTPNNYPVFYDRWLANHGGRGIYVVRVDGEVFWDRGAEWLLSFCKTHQDLRLPLPEDISAPAP